VVVAQQSSGVLGAQAREATATLQGAAMMQGFFSRHHPWREGCRTVAVAPRRKLPKAYSSGDLALATQDDPPVGPGTATTMRSRL